MANQSRDRREFLQESAAFSSAAAVAGMMGLPNLSANEAPIPEDEKLGVALVGLGMRGCFLAGQRLQ